MVLKKSASDKDLSSIYRSSPLSLPTTPPRLIKRGKEIWEKTKKEQDYMCNGRVLGNMNSTLLIENNS